ncbi:MAG: helix-turn-helix domain-containing protein [Anaerolineaceae bacterium]|jgi:uncharacterized Tic20 family protein|nr:helix-turn-helix domain-containing protein [Anaerolineaceae bacterium]
MNQPDLGYKVAEVRQQKGFTQEQLAEYCEVSTRTIQRIESGEVEPRPFTRNSLSNILDFDFNESNIKNEGFWLASLHLSSMFSIVLIPLLIWSWKKKQSYKIDRHGRDVLNFQITVTLMLFAAVFLLAFVLPVGAMMFAMESGQPNLGIMGILPFVGIFPLVAIGIFTTWQGVVNTIRVMSDKPYKYLLSIPFIK